MTTEGEKPPVTYSSWSLTEDEPAIKYEHVWTVTNFDKKMKTGGKLNSGYFRNPSSKIHTNWYMTMYPNGVSENDKGYVSLYLHRESEFSPAEVKCCFRVMINGGTIIFRKIRFSNESTSCGCKHFIKHSSIKPNNENTFTVLCELSVAGECVVNIGKNIETHSVKIEPTSSSMSAFSQLSQDMYWLLESGELSDCTVVSGGREFKCHKAILGGRSSVFKEIFGSNVNDHFSDRVMRSSVFKEKFGLHLNDHFSDKIVIEDYDEDTVIEMLFYIYTGTTRNLHSRAAFLLSAAEKYRLEELKKICESNLCDNLNSGNVCDLMILSTIENSSRLHDAAL